MNINLITAAIAALLCGGSLALAQSGSNAPSQPKPTVLLIHGAFAESSSWNGVIRRLASQGYPAIAIANPLRGLKTDSDSVMAVIKSIDGPVILVGHSYGGSVITNAAFGQDNVKALVYIDGTAPEFGESTSGLAAKFPGSTLGPTLAPPVKLPDGGKDLYIRRQDYHQQFAAEVPEAEAELMYATQRPITESALNEPAGNPAWKTIPSWFIYGQLDKNIPPKAHAFMAERANAIETIGVEGASHVVMVSHPDEVADLIERAAQYVSHQSTAAIPVNEAVARTESQQSASSDFPPAPVVALTSEEPARLIVDEPLPEQLAGGYVVVRYRAENIRILPVYGPAAANVLPRIGHLHITVDDLPWHWLDASDQPLSVSGLPPGKHKILFELESAAHHVIDSKTVTFEIPPRQ